MSINKFVWFSDVPSLKKIGHFDDNSSQLRVDIYKLSYTYTLILSGRMSQAERRGPWASCLIFGRLPKHV